MGWITRAFLLVSLMQCIGCSPYFQQLIEDNRNIAKDPAYIEMQLMVYEASMRRQFPNR
ncbi:hypothetical protein [Desulfovibrio sp. ZJ200]|uniref:hypothetical protein n=1 Tax=Desulfovibrio sp. ZJ200 TaxID=2709792 RepID=UPI0013ECC375|nr:hypothetical protein [Desulfovibrio sp. ZJ200]